MAKASNAEVQSHLYAAIDLGYLDQNQFQTMYEQAEECSKQLAGLISYLFGRKR